MNLRSLLFVPGDRPERMEKAQRLGARALILDLEDAVAPASKPEARRLIASFLGEAERKCLLFVRINPLDSGLSGEDLAAVVPARPDGIVLPKCDGPATLAELDRQLTALEDQHGLPIGQIAILPIGFETPAALFQTGNYAGISPRLAGLTWGAEDLSSALGASTSRDAEGQFTAPFATCRTLTLFAATAASAAPIETVFPAFRDLDGLKAFALRAKRDGFLGMMAIHPAQVPVIEEAFAPNEAEIAHAQAVVAAFAAEPGAGALSLNGKMIDRPHLVQAERLLGL